MSPRPYRMSRRHAASEETCRRIVAATMDLHLERGVRATSWEDIAQLAGVATATVYRYFPSLDELLPACGALVMQTVRPPDPEGAGALFAGGVTPTERLDRLVQEWCAFYARSHRAWDTVLRERHLYAPLAEWAEQQEATLTAYVRAALGSVAPEPTVQLVAALTGYPVWKALVDRGFAPESVPDTVNALVTFALVPAAVS